jgi:hypothetical protein
LRSPCGISIGHRNDRLTVNFAAIQMWGRDQESDVRFIPMMAASVWSPTSQSIAATFIEATWRN